MGLHRQAAAPPLPRPGPPRPTRRPKPTRPPRRRRTTRHRPSPPSDARTGAIHYEERLLGSSSASLLEAEGRIYAIDEAGLAAVVRAGKTFQLLATNDLQEQTLASMSVCDSDLLIRTEKALYRIGRGAGK